MTKIKLIIADDEYFIRARLAKIISEKREDINIVSLCEDGEDVLKLLALSNVDILLMDIKMISLSGLEVAKFVYDNKLNTKIILVSGYNEFNYAVEAMRYGVFDYLSKPISEEDLLSAVDKCILSVNEAKNMSKDTSKTLLSPLFPKENTFTSNKDISNVRPLVIKYMVNSDEESYKNFIKENTGDIIDNYNATTLYKFIREVINTLDVKYHILQNLTLVEYMQAYIFDKNVKSVDELNKILMDIGSDCMSLNIASTKEQLISRQIIEDIEKHFCESDYNVTDIAKNLGKNPSYLNTVFKKVHGRTIKHTLSEYRLEKARKLLRLGTPKILDVALQCGYTDIFYFSKRYKSKFGYPPSEENLKA